MKKTLLAFGAFALLTAIGCKKENENEAQAVTKENVAGSYKLASAKAKVNGTEFDLVATGAIEACAADDVMTLNADLTFANADAGAKCNPPTDVTGETWSINGNTIQFDGEVFTVTTLTKKQMVITQTYDDNGASTTLTATWNRQ